MRRMHAITTILAAVSAASILVGTLAQAAEIRVSPEDDLQEAVNRAKPEDMIVLSPGVHKGPVVIRAALSLKGEPGAIVQGPGSGSVITLEAPGSSVRNLTVRGSGTDIPDLDSGIYVADTATGAKVENNRLEGNLYGIYLHGAPDSIARGNIVIGMKDGRRADAGNGISVWNAPGAKVLDNQFYYGRDGIYVQASKRNVFSGNFMRDVRFGIHYMYADDSEVTDNISIGNHIGFAIMFSTGLVIRNNISDGDRDQGFQLNYANQADISGNLVQGRLQPAERWLLGGGSSGHGAPSEIAQPVKAGTQRIGPEKCVFIYNANFNRFHENWFEGCDIGVHFTAGSEGNEMFDNAFVANRNQVKYVSTRFVDWSSQGRGNYWSDNPAFDLNGDGLADTAYRPNDIVDKVLWTTPQAKVLVNSPSVQMIRWAQSQFPALYPGGVVDSKPLMKPPQKPRFTIPSLPAGAAL